MDEIEAARAWARDRCKAMTKGWQSACAGPGPAYYALREALRIEWNIDEDGHRRGYRVSDEAAHYLYVQATTCPDAYDLASEIAFHNVNGSVEMPMWLRVFAMSMPGEALQRPRRRGKKRNDYWYRDYLILEILEDLVARFAVKATRNEATAKRASACDIVSNAIAEAGDPTLTYDAVKKIRNRKTLREELRLIRAFRASRHEPELPTFVLAGEPPFLVGRE